LEIPELEASPENGQQLQQKDKKRRKRRGEKNNNKTEKPKDVGPFLVQKQTFDFRAYMYLSKACCHIARLFV